MQLQDKDILNFANEASELCNQLGKNIKLPISEIKVVGVQSSGKSSTLKRIIGLDILPTGDVMITRTPIKIRLIHIAKMNSTLLKLSKQLNGKLENIHTVEIISNDKDKENKLNEFKTFVSNATDEITGGKYIVSNIPLFIDIHSNKVPNLSFTDLPGIIMTALSDKGQAENLPEQIKNLIKEELLIPNSIALVVIRSGNDLETDPGIALINEIKSIKKNQIFDTIGILTKVDLLGDFDLRNNLNYLIAGKMVHKNENLSNNLKMSEGFFLLSNACMTIKDEIDYFHKNFDNNREIILENRYGIKNLQNYLQIILINSIKKIIPELKNELISILKDQKQKLKYLGTELKTEQEKITYLINLQTLINKMIRDSICSFGIDNISTKIGKLQTNFLNQINNIKPFDDLQDEYFLKIIDNFDGFNMTPQINIEQLADICINDESHKPINLIFPIAEKYVELIIDVLNENMIKIIESYDVSNLNAFPKLKNKILQILLNKIKTYQKNTIDCIKSVLITHGVFFWSSDESFKKIFLTNDDKNYSYESSFSPNKIRKILSKYYEIIIANVRDYIIKVVIEKIVNEVKNNKYDLDNGESLVNYIVENDLYTNKRIISTNLISKLDAIIKIV
jgi:hypothetical protein